HHAKLRSHQLTITGPETERERFMVECFSHANGEARFDFDKLIPQPEHIKTSTDIQFRSGNLPDWYEWRCKNLGDKWNAGGTDVEHKGEAIRLVFSTAWSVPAPIFKEVVKRFPTLRIEALIRTVCSISAVTFFATTAMSHSTTEARKLDRRSKLS